MSFKENHQQMWGMLTHQEIKLIIDSDPKDFRSTMCYHVKGAFCPDCNYKKLENHNNLIIEPITVKPVELNMEKWK